MGMSTIIRRLGWKEFRLGWPLLAAGLALPPLAEMLAARDMEVLGFHPLRAVVFLLMVTVTIWAALLAPKGRPGRAFAGTHFPLHPAWRTLVTYLFHGGIVLLIGANFWLSCIRFLDLEKAVNPFLLVPESPWQIMLRYLALALLYFASTFAISFAVSLALSPSAGSAAGLLWMLGNLPVLKVLTPPSIAYYYLLLDWPWHIRFMAASLGAAALAITLALVLVRPAFPARRVLACALLGLVAIGFPLYNRIWLQQEKFHPTPSPVHSADGSLVLEDISPFGEKDAVTLQFADYRSRRAVTRRFPRHVLPLGLLGRETAVLALPQPGERRITLLCWSLETNAIEELVSLPARRNTLKEVIIYRWASKKIPDSISPDQRVILLILPSMIGEENYDLWRIDIATRHAEVMQPMCKVDTSSTISWRGDEAIIYGFHDPLLVSLTTGRITPLPLPAPREEER